MGKYNWASSFWVMVLGLMVVFFTVNNEISAVSYEISTVSNIFSTVSYECLCGELQELMNRAVNVLVQVNLQFACI